MGDTTFLVFIACPVLWIFGYTAGRADAMKRFISMMDDIIRRQDENVADLQALLIKMEPRP